MKKKTISSIIVIAVLSIAVWNLKYNKTNNAVNEMTKLNIEVLAQAETNCPNTGPVELSFWSGKYCKCENYHCCSY